MRTARTFALVTTIALALSTGRAFALGEQAQAELKSADGRDVGTVRMIETTAGVLMKLKLKGLPPGPHGLHIHETGKCEGDFTSAGSIYNPLGAKHGYLNDEGPMVGDLPNIFIPATGDIEIDLVSPFVTLNRTAEVSMFDADGTALILREKPDDYMTEPEGNSGSRIACGVITVAK